MDNKIIISKSKLIKSLNFSESNRLILGTSGRRYSCSIDFSKKR